MAKYVSGIPKDTPLGMPNCGVITTALVCGISHSQAAADIAEVGNRSKRWKGSTFDYEREKVYRKYGLKFEKRLEVGGMTLRQFLASEYFNRRGTYEVVITRHSMLLHRNRMFDQRYAQGVCTWELDKPYLRKRVVHIIEFTGGSPLM